MRRRAVTGAAASLVLAMGLSLPGAAAVDPDATLRQVLDAAFETDFDATLVVRWYDGDRWHEDQVLVRASDGIVELEDERRAIGARSERFVESEAGWLSVVGGGPIGVEPGEKWELAAGDARYSGRRCSRIDVVDRSTGRVRERMWVDDATGLMLRRERFDRFGVVVHVVELRDLRVGDRASGGLAGEEEREEPPVTTPSDGSADEREADVVEAPYRAPVELADGFHLVGRYERPDGSVHLFYSDGVFRISVFQQRGELDWDALPGDGDDAVVAGRDAVVYHVADGEVAVTESDGIVVTAVSDMPIEELDDVLHPFVSSPRPSTLDRVVDAVLGPFRWV